MPSFHEFSVGQLRQALQLREQIESLQQKLDAIFGGSGDSAPAVPVKTKSAGDGKKGKRTMSPEAREKMRAAQQARWAKVKGENAASTKASTKAAPKKRKLTAEGKAKLSAALKASWAARKKSAAAPNAAAAPKVDMQSAPR